MGMGAALAGGISAIGGIASGVMSSNAAGKAADKQAAAANIAATNQYNQWVMTRDDLRPDVDAGQNALTTLGQQMPALTTAFQPTEAQVEATPGYQFTRNQGLQAVQNSASARGLGVSGAALKGAANYATGLADNTYLDQANLYYKGQDNAYSKLMGVANLGENAAATTGSQGVSAINNSNNYLTSGANAQAAGIIGSANAINGAIGSVSNAAQNYLMGSSLMQGGVGGGGGGIVNGAAGSLNYGANRAGQMY